MSTKPPSKEEDDDNEVIGSGRIMPPPLSEGDDYLAVYSHKEIGEYKGRKRLFLWFNITTVEGHFRGSLFLACAFPKNGGTVFGTGSKLMEAFSVALGHKPALRKGVEFKTKYFRGKTFRVRVRTVIEDSEGNLRDPGSWYSVIDRLLNIVEPKPEPESESGPEGGKTE